MIYNDIHIYIIYIYNILQFIYACIHNNALHIDTYMHV